MLRFSRFFAKAILLLGAGVAAFTQGPELQISRAPRNRAQHYVSPAGSSEGDGTIERPWDLQTALYHPKSVAPGATIWIRGGTYGDGKAIFYSRLVGTADAPIIVRQYPGERATINGWLQVGCCDKDPHPEQGAYVWFWGLEFASSISDRTGAADGPPEYGASAVLNSIDTWAPGSKFINNVIHDTRMGISMWQEATGAEAYGNIIYFNGFQASDRGHGHGFYVQNVAPQMEIANNIIFDQFDNGLQLYGSSNAAVKNLLLQSNISFNNGLISTGPQPADNVILSNSNGIAGVQMFDNHLYFTPALNQGYNELGWDAPNRDIVAQRNYFIGGFKAAALVNWQSVTFQNNTIYSADKYVVTLSGEIPAAGFTWDNNSYYGSGLCQYNESGTFFDGWPAKTGLDTHSTYQPGAPTGTWKFVMRNKYESGRAHIAIYNWDSASSVAVDLRDAMEPGTEYEIRDAQNLFGRPVAGGTYDGAPVVVPMIGLTIATPNGRVPNLPSHTAPQFGTFVLLSGASLQAQVLRPAVSRPGTIR